MPTKRRPLWRCPKCGERFVTKNLWHSCGKFTLRSLFAKSDPEVAKLFRELTRMVRTCGPARMIPQKTRAVFQVRMRFAGCYPRKSHLICDLVLRRRLEGDRITKVDQYGPEVFVNQIRIASEDDLDAQLQNWLCEAYQVGAQTV
jgi:Domain of unknown function (DUF5655)